jgi:hypothetical protein
MPEYTLTAAELRSLKAKLTRVKNSGDVGRVRAAVAAAHAVFDEKGWPDCHHDWQRALDDAEMKARFA